MLNYAVQPSLHTETRNREGASSPERGVQRDDMSGNSSAAHKGLTPLEREGLDWFFRVMAKSATDEDRAAVEHWKSQSPAHAEAFDRAGYLCELISLQQDFRDTHPPFLHKPATRRAAMGMGAGAILTYGLVRPPLRLWPSLAELTSDYRSGVGERQDVALAQGVSVELNTGTSLSRHAEAGKDGVQLISGEIAITARRPTGANYMVFAGSGQVFLQQAVCDVRMAAEGIRVLCLEGAVTVRAAGGRQTLAPRQQLLYTASSLGQPVEVDPILSTAWREGRLVFRDAPFQAIVGEVNRYRSGRILVANSELAQRRFNAVFEIQNLAGIVNDLQRLSHSSATTVGNLTVIS